MLKSQVTVSRAKKCDRRISQCIPAYFGQFPISLKDNFM